MWRSLARTGLCKLCKCALKNCGESGGKRRYTCKYFSEQWLPRFACGAVTLCAGLLVDRRFVFDAVTAVTGL